MKHETSVLFVILSSLILMVGFAGPVAAQVGQQQGLVDPNIATEADLLKLPHTNAALAKGIVERRPFLTMAALDSFLGQSLSKEQRAELYGKAFVHLNLNTAADAEILMIPNLGSRMLREFKEYRPYAGLAQFRREIGKYVDAQELARLEKYVFVPINLNTASDADILSIPGLGPRMLREFKEYRPYGNIEQFRREIGKYVDAKEIARMERYVTIQ
jgi:DNA uptake protein ComE-like DNA-binding protein